MFYLPQTKIKLHVRNGRTHTRSIHKPQQLPACGTFSWSKALDAQEKGQICPDFGGGRGEGKTSLKIEEWKAIKQTSGHLHYTAKVLPENDSPFLKQKAYTDSLARCIANIAETNQY